MEGLKSKIVEWGIAGRQMPGQALSGDLYLVKPLENGVLVAVADGLGHGQPAAEAASLALQAVEEDAQNLWSRPLSIASGECVKRVEPS